MMNMNTEPTESQMRALDKSLQHAYSPPVVPQRFRAALMEKVLREQMALVESRKDELEHEYAQAIAQLRRSHVRMKRDTLALIIGVAFAAGACADVALPWIQSLLGADGAAAMPLLALLIGVVSGASVWWDRFGKAQ
jgi:hypothetical protein